MRKVETAGRSFVFMISIVPDSVAFLENAFSGGPGASRTPDQEFRKLAFYL